MNDKEELEQYLDALIHIKKQLENDIRGSNQEKDNDPVETAGYILLKCETEEEIHYLTKIIYEND